MSYLLCLLLSKYFLFIRNYDAKEEIIIFAPNQRGFYDIKILS